MQRPVSLQHLSGALHRYTSVMHHAACMGSCTADSHQQTVSCNVGQACGKQPNPSGAVELLQSAGWWRPHEQIGLIKANRSEFFPPHVQVLTAAMPLLLPASSRLATQIWSSTCLATHTRLTPCVFVFLPCVTLVVRDLRSKCCSISSCGFCLAYQHVSHCQKVVSYHSVEMNSMQPGCKAQEPIPRNGHSTVCSALTF